MKSIILFTVMLFAFAMTNAQTKMYVNKNSGGIDSISLNDIKGITFKNISPHPSIADGILIAKSTSASNTYSLLRMTSSGTDLRVVIPSTTGKSLSYARWSSDLSKVIYTSNNSTNGQIQLFIADSNGANVFQITNCISPYNVGSQPEFFSGTKVWYSLQKAGWSEVYSINTDGTGNIQVSNGATENKEYNRTVFNSSRTRTIFCKTAPFAGSTADIYSSNVDFTNQVLLTNNSNITDYEFDLSRDGSKIVWCQEKNSSGIFNLLVMDIDGSNQNQITNYTTGNAFFPRWSSDGTQIIYSRYDGIQWDIYRINVDGSNSVNVTNTTDFDEWSFDWK